MANGETTIEAQEKRDRVPAGVHRRLFDAGLVTTDGTRRVPRVETVVDRIRPWQPDVIVADRFRFDELMDVSAKMDADVTLGFDRLMASDLSGRARAFQSMVGGGMDPGKAAGLAGLMESE